MHGFGVGFGRGVGVAWTSGMFTPFAVTVTAFDDGTLHVDFAHQEVTVDGTAVVLTPTEYRLLATLARHQGQVLSSDQLIELAWDDPSGLAPSRVKYAVLRLRRKLGWDEGDDTPIETVRGFGYRYRTRSR